MRQPKSTWTTTELDDINQCQEIQVKERKK